jgi:hypothetical protein
VEREYFCDVLVCVFLVFVCVCSCCCLCVNSQKLFQIQLSQQSVIFSRIVRRQVSNAETFSN